MSDKAKHSFLSNMPAKPVVGILILICICILLLWTCHVSDSRAESAMMGQIRLDGNYRIGDGPWQPIEAGSHIPPPRAM